MLSQQVNGRVPYSQIQAKHSVIIFAAPLIPVSDKLVVLCLVVFVMYNIVLTVNSMKV